MKTPAFWQTRSAASLLLSPLALAYRVGNWLDRTTTHAHKIAMPVISVGNATAGGAGKTPVTLALIPIIESLGATPHILTRGYKGDTALGAHRVQPGDDWRMVGDEALLLARAATTWAGRDRVESAQAAARSGATLAIADDAHQHYRLHKDIAFLVIDGPYGIGNGCLLPAGPLREPFAAALARADAIILIGEDAQQITARIDKPVFCATLTPTSAPATLTSRPWLAFAGIGRPEKFFASLRTLGATLAATRAFPDHHAYSDADAQNLLDAAKTLGAQLITTEKDAVKLPLKLVENTTVLPVTLTFTELPALTAFLRSRLA